jgi:DNA-binding XRE family transcriptional regulator
MGVVLVKNADRMITSANLLKEGVEITFADGCRGVVPFADIPEVRKLQHVKGIELPNPYELILHTKLDESLALPWDFARHYCDSSYRPRVEVMALAGRHAIGLRIRQVRESAGLTQEALARAANIGRVTLVRLENGEQSPRYETLVSLAQALKRPIQELLAGPEAASA